MEIQEFIGRSHLDGPTLHAWIEAEWLVPLSSGNTFLFSEADVARARLIQDLKVDFGVNDEGIGIPRRWNCPIEPTMSAERSRPICNPTSV
jgi:chaperone modulatory protein CbpM